MANALAAMSAILWAIASCLPTGTPHWTRAFDHLRQTSSSSLTPPLVPAGKVRRPVFSVTRAILRPMPSPPIRFCLGILTLVKLITALPSALRPMK